ncbi:hypothetical protein BD414DRAFT_445877 [Trametes punicea]|nr:hypothetical protein BD414DRAFT_445877 [Trametes punicea]
MLTLRAAGILSTTFEAILYGYAVFMFSLAMWIMLKDRRHRQVNWALVAAGCALMILATAEMAVNITRLFQGFLTQGPFLPGGPEQFFAVVSEPTFVAKSVLYNVQTLILDAVVIYRTYVVWQSALIVLLPVTGWCGLLAGSIGLNVALVNAEHMGDVFAVQTGRWITAVYALTLGTNLSSTILLAWRIWTVARRSAQYRASNIFSPVLRVIIESGAIYSMTITAALISFVVQSNGVYVMLDMISPIISIVYNMLIIRMGLAGDRAIFGNGGGGLGGGTGTAGLPWQAGTSGSGWGGERSGAGLTVRRRADGSRYEMTDLKVEITQVIEDDSEYAVTGPHHVGGAPLPVAVGTLTTHDIRVMRSAADEDDALEGSSPHSSFHERQEKAVPV